jgi:hypothetical protein
MLHETASLEALDDALAALQVAGVTLLVVDGGDGTVREVLTRIPSHWGEAAPRLAILAHGNTNLIARHAGSVSGADGLARLVGAAGAGRLAETRLPVLTVDRGDGQALRGFIMGWGAYATGTRIAAEEIAARGGGQVALAVAATLRRALIGGEATAIRAGVEASLSIDGSAAPSGARLVGLATTLPGSLVMELNPFWGGGRGRLRWLDVDAPGRRLALAVPFALAGRPLGWMARAGYRSGRAETIALDLASPFILDGERFDPGATGRLRLAAAEDAVFVTPA